MTEMSLKNVLVILFLCSFSTHHCVQLEHGPVKTALLQTWAEKLYFELWNCGEYITNRKSLQAKYNKESRIEEKNGEILAANISSVIKSMMDKKQQALKRILDTVEGAAFDAHNKPVPSNSYLYRSAKPDPEKPNSSLPLNLVANSHFFNTEVNLSYSSVHVPTYVYDRASDVLKSIKWSENLDAIFDFNYRNDPRMSWQYFGSTTGFMRQYPAMSWTINPVDLYDCRMRPWYVEAAACPKDILILVDNSGSMMGQSKIIARHVINTLLDTLSVNDYVNVLVFNNETEEVVPCYKDLLVQATLANIRELKLGVENIAEPNNISDFRIALTVAFKTLEKYREQKRGTMCNQAIMLVTDGVPENFYELFKLFNWREGTQGMPVRVFTYLIGREVPETRDVKWMACANHGFFVHLRTVEEVREQVVHYLPVMARPLVLHQTYHPTIWTPLYADITDPKMTDYLWEREECNEQREKTLSYKKMKNKFFFPKNLEKWDRDRFKKEQNQNTNINRQKSHNLITSIAMPAYDKITETNITVRRLINDNIWVWETRETKVAHLLGVVGTDVPEADLREAMMPHVLGVNNYAFIVTNNGFVITHPDLRPVFGNILKPNYNSIDMIEVEQVESDQHPREYHEDLLKLRGYIINHTTGDLELSIKYHYDNLRRAATASRHYYYSLVEGTPYTVVVALQEKHFGHSVRIPDRFQNLSTTRSSLLDYFKDDDWKIHPDWLYCRYEYDRDNNYTKEEELKHFLMRISTRSNIWNKWPPPRFYSESYYSNGTKKPEEYHDCKCYCNKELMLSLIYDANITKGLFTESKDDPDKKKKNEFEKRFGVTLAFVATHSGLTRWIDYKQKSKSLTPQFIQDNIYSIEEVWYRRAVEYNSVYDESYVYSVPFEIENTRTTLVTASQAVFVSNKDTKPTKKAAAAVVGYQFRHSALQELFINITRQCYSENGCSAKDTCESDERDCYILDNNGYIIASENVQETGMFFGKVNGIIMKMMVADKVFKEIRIFDYQGVCFKREHEDDSSSASFLLTPIHHLRSIIGWLIGRMFLVAAQTNFQWMLSQAQAIFEDISDYMDDEENNYTEEQLKSFQIEGERALHVVMINRTRPKTCDRVVNLYTLTSKIPERIERKFRCDRPYEVRKIMNTNLILLVVDGLCTENDTMAFDTIPHEVPYKNISLSCHKATSSLPRNRPKMACIRTHPQEHEIYDKMCGKGISLVPTAVLILLFSTFNFLKLL
ncbi:voltage-dependent calcium channel subunit alpha-2/delta-3 isoform X2 [Daktulosphaira vitifoliae]|uniref:voltage-dependent calcium channel subunit alpha-2/delta-3 isoform X2 n=1 Tax=Daktulosphaira vitifoliae TaxID=58002 RepID=UPI0021AAF035|nr:voltage-dependent calcium channel subunit alpha-2/delta-3 isoform X2 [Daktulosphaira vitifoliae]